MTEPAQISVTMIHTLLMFAATNEYNPNTVAAYNRLKAARQDPEMDAYADDLAEEMAQVHFPTGTTCDIFGWSFEINCWYCDLKDGFSTFADLMQAVSGAECDRLTPLDPTHVAMVLRALAISNSLEVSALPPTVVVAHDSPEPDAGALAQNGYWIRLVRGGGKFAYGSMIGSGHWFAYTNDNPAENFDPVKAVWRWFLVRHQEATEALAKMQDAPEETEPANNVDTLG